MVTQLLQTGEFTSNDGRYVYVDTLDDHKTLVELLESAEPRVTAWERPEDDSIQPLLGTNKVEQLAFVVKDLDAAADAYSKLLGVEKTSHHPFWFIRYYKRDLQRRPTEGKSAVVFHQ